MAEYFAGGHLRFVNGEWRDDNGNAIEISRVRHGRWEWFKNGWICDNCDGWNNRATKFCPHCGAKMDGGDGNSDMA